LLLRECTELMRGWGDVASTTSSSAAIVCEPA
jgi:hypothetical protein